MRLIPLKKTRDSNAVYTGLPGEVVVIPDEAIALHDGSTPGGLLFEPPTVFAGDNIARNTNFQFDQNGNSFIGNSGDTYIMDGWYTQHAGGSTDNAARLSIYENFLKSSTYARVTTFSGGGSDAFTILSQRYARPTTMAGRRMTLSFSMRCNENYRSAVEFGQTFADPGTQNRNILVGNVDLEANTWKRFEFTFDVPEITSSDVIDNSTDHSFLYFWLEAGDDYNTRTGGILPFSGSFDIGNIKLEQASKATEYRFDFQDEQRRVYEYFEKNSRVQFFAPLGVTNPGASCGITVDFGFPKWTSLPTITFNTDFVNAPTLNARDQFGFTLTGSANNAGSSARVLDYTVNAEIPF